jgi:hypothetical protein
MDYVTELRIKYPYLSPQDCAKITSKAKMIYFGLRYPSEPFASEETHPLKTFFEQTWIESACDEIVERLGFNSAIGYRENGVSWNFDGAILSNRLCNLVMPEIGVIK